MLSGSTSWRSRPFSEELPDGGAGVPTGCSGKMAQPPRLRVLRRSLAGPLQRHSDRSMTARWRCGLQDWVPGRRFSYPAGPITSADVLRGGTEGAGGAGAIDSIAVIHASSLPGSSAAHSPRPNARKLSCRDAWRVKP